MSGGALLDTHALIALRALARSTDQMEGRLSGLPGGFLAKRRGQGMEIADLRVYSPGDDIRAIDPHATARTGELHVRTYQDERDRTTLLVADFRPSMLWGVKRAFRSVAAAEALTLLGWRAIEAGGRVGALILSAGHDIAVPARSRQGAMLDVIGALVRGHAAAIEAAREDLEDPPLDAGIGRAARLIGSGARLILASGLDTPGTALRWQLRALTDRADLRVLAIGDGLASGMPEGIYPMERADGTRARVRLGAEKPAASDPEDGIPATPLDPAWPPARVLATLDGRAPRA